MVCVFIKRDSFSNFFVISDIYILAYFALCEYTFLNNSESQKPKWLRNGAFQDEFVYLINKNKIYLSLFIRTLYSPSISATLNVQCC
jgi:hypothetical protein